MQDNLQDLQPTIEETQPQNTDLQPTTTANQPHTTTKTENVNPLNVIQQLQTPPIVEINEGNQYKKTDVTEKTTPKQPFAITLKFFGESATHIESIINEGIKYGCWSNKTQFVEQCIDFAINHNLAKNSLPKGLQLSFPYPDGLHGSNHIPNKLLKNSRYKEILKNIPQL